MKKILGIIAALVVSGQTMAYGQYETPPFTHFICEAGDVSIQVEIQHFRQSAGTGPVVVISGDMALNGGWQWKAAEEGTRLGGHYLLDIKTISHDGHGSVNLKTLYSPYNELSGGWLETNEYSGSVKCKITKEIVSSVQGKQFCANNGGHLFGIAVSDDAKLYFMDNTAGMPGPFTSYRVLEEDEVSFTVGHFFKDILNTDIKPLTYIKLSETQIQSGDIVLDSEICPAL